MKKTLLRITTLLLGFSLIIATPQAQAKNKAKKPKKKTEKTAPKPAEKRVSAVCDTLTLICFNDFHGSFLEDKTVPGAARVVSTVKQLRKNNPDLLVLAAGDNYSGGYFSRVVRAEPLPDFFGEMQVAYSAFGNHEFDWGISTMEKMIKKGGAQYLSANIFLDPENQTRPAWAKPYAIRTMQMKNGNTLRLAIIGIATPETKTSAMPEIVAELTFDNPVKIARQIRTSLQDSADLYLLLTHIGTYMQDNTVMFENEDEDLTTVSGIDGIFTGHSHKEVCGLKNGIPVVQARNYGRKLARMRFEISADKKGNKNCRFLDMELLPIGEEKDHMMSSALENFVSNPTIGLNEIICKNDSLLDPDAFIPHTQFSMLGSLVTQSYAWRLRTLLQIPETLAVIGVCNLGSIRTTLPEGDVTRLQIGNVLPFGGLLNAFHFSGNDLLALLQYGIECKTGWMQYHDMKVEIKDGKVRAAWYKDPQGAEHPVMPDEDYIVVTEHFLSSGGDGYPAELFSGKDRAFNRVDPDKRNPTDTFIEYLKNLGKIDAAAAHIPTVVE